MRGSRSGEGTILVDIERREIAIRDLVENYSDDGEGGVVGYGSRLDIRPVYQREFVYQAAQRDDVIRSVLAGFPLNVMYWARLPRGRYEVLDGQQRTISICQYVNGEFSINNLYYSNQPDDVRERIDSYELTIYVCDGNTSEKLDWFRIVNIAGEALTDQELRNAVYAGPWVTDAKRYFSRSGCAAKGIADPYLKDNPIRQELLRTAIRWASDGKIEDYMGLHQHESDADGLWSHFQTVIEWIETTFPNKRPQIMRNVDWGPLYAQHRDESLDATALEEEIRHLVSLGGKGRTNPIRKLSGVYAYALDGDERHLNLRTFDNAQKTAAYERQDRKCANCRKGFEFRQMEGDHIKSWNDGGLTEDDNLQMLCKSCNGSKGAG